MKTKQLLYIISKAPYSNAAGQEALDAALVGASFDQDVSLVFVHDGVYQLLVKQNTTGSGVKQFTKSYRALKDFGVNQVYCHDLSLQARGVLSEDLMLAALIVTSQQLEGLISAADRVFTF